MQEIIQVLAVIFMILCGFGIMFTPRKRDPFLLTRPVGRYAKRIASRSIALGYKSLKRWTKSMWVIANNAHYSPVKRVFAAVLLPVLAVGVAVLLIPADIFGSGKK